MADHGVKAEQRLYQLMAEVTAQDFARRSGEEIHHMALALEAQPPHIAAQLRNSDCSSVRTDAGIGRTAQQPLPYQPDDGVQRRQIGVVIASIGRTMARDLAPGQPVPPGQQIVRVFCGQELSVLRNTMLRPCA